MATLKTNSHKMAEFTISFFSCLHHSFIHSFKNYSSNVHYVSSAFLGIKRITKEAHYVIWFLSLMSLGEGSLWGRKNTPENI